MAQKKKIIPKKGIEQGKNKNPSKKETDDIPSIEEDKQNSGDTKIMDITEGSTGINSKVVTGNTGDVEVSDTIQLAEKGVEDMSIYPTIEKAIYKPSPTDLNIIQEQEEQVLDILLGMQSSITKKRTLTTLDQVPIWHPLKYKFHIELFNEYFDNITDHVDPTYDPHDKDKDCFIRTIGNIFSTFLQFKLRLAFIEFFSSVQKFDINADIDNPHIEDWKEFISTPMIHLRHLTRSNATLILCHRICPNKKGIAQLFHRNMKTKHMVHVLYLKPKSLLLSQSHPILDEIHKDIHQMLKESFDSFSDDEKFSVDMSLTNGNAFVIYSLNAAGNSKIPIGVVLFSADKDGIWINWLAIANQIFDKERFGKSASKEPFRNSGFGTFLLLLVQLRSNSYQWSTNIYL